METKEKILVLDSKTNSGRAVIKSLKKANYDITELNLDKDEKYSELILKFLIEKKDQNIHFHIIIPCTDESLIPLLDKETEIRALTKFPFPNKENILKSQNKLELLTLGGQIGLLTPKSVDIIFNNDQNLFKQRLSELSKLNFPIILKPKRSVQNCSFGNNFKPERFIINNKERLEEVFNKLNSSNTEYIAQPYITGHGIGYFSLFRDGKSVLDFAHRRILEKPPEGGVSVLCSSLQADSEILKKVHALLVLLEWEGVAMLEFRADENGNLYLMEINPRFWGSLQLAINCGYDFPLYLVNEKIIPVDSQFKSGFYIWPRGLLDYFLIKLKRLVSKYFASRITI